MDTIASECDEQGQSAFHRWKLVVILTFLYALSLLDRQIIALLIDDIRADLRISDFQISLLQGIAFAAFYAVFGLFFGRAVDVLSRRAVVTFGVTVWSIASASCGLAQNFWQLAMARFGLGAGEAALAPAAYSMIADSFPKRQLAFALAVFGTGATLGTALSGSFGGLLIYFLQGGITVPVLGHLATWQAVFLVTGLPGLVLAWVIFAAGEPQRRHASQQRPRLSDSLDFMRQRWRFFLGHFVGFGLQSMCAYSLMAWMAIFIHRRYGWSMPEVAAAQTVINLVLVFTAHPLTGYIADRWYRTGRTDAALRLFAFNGVLQILFIFLGVSANSPLMAFAMFFLWGTVSNCTGPAAAALQMVTPSELRGQISSFYILVFNLLGVGLGATIAGAFSTYLFADDKMIGWSVFLTFAIFMPIAIGFLISAMKPMREALARQGESPSVS